MILSLGASGILKKMNYIYLTGLESNFEVKCCLSNVLQKFGLESKE